ncbi:MAG TPA: hypothetical protein VK559_00650 [Ferruginibacter sp.]|nr:hypothetical protein [Ferruginibacter sp.]
MRKPLYILAISVIILMTGCIKKRPRNFFPDQNDPNLSRLTDYGYNIATNYINTLPYINPYINNSIGNAVPTVEKIFTTSTFDTLSISWPILIDTTAVYSQYTKIAILLPISKSFSGNDFLALSGQRFTSNTCTLQLTQNTSFDVDTLLSGTANIYFIKTGLTSPTSSLPENLMFAGLFNGAIGDSITVTKGRFDFSIPVTSINF